MNGLRNSSLSTYSGHENTIYCVKWSPHIPDTYASTSGISVKCPFWASQVIMAHGLVSFLGDGTIRIWNTNSLHPAQVIPGGGGEILTCDWTKYDQVW